MPKKTILVSVFLAVAVGILVGFLIVKANPDYISDSFTDESKIGRGTKIVNVSTSSGQVSLPTCYYANPSWTKIADTIVRDISTTSASATTAKDIYCDDSNCILYTDGLVPPNPVCIATDPNVYANILWARYDSGTAAWASGTATSTLISGGDVGGSHPAGLLVGANNVNVGGKNWLERYYDSPPGTFPAMDKCKAKGSGWRLPTILELDSIRDMTTVGAPYSRLPNITSNWYWSSSEADAGYAYTLMFTYVGVPYYINAPVGNYPKSSSYYVRCVRDY
jgi:hypothetical protein